MTTTDAAGSVAGVEKSLALAAEALRRGQDATGYWKGDFETSLIGESGEVILRHYLRLPPDETVAAAARTILSEQTSTGGWASYHEGPDELLLSVHARHDRVRSFRGCDIASFIAPSLPRSGESHTGDAALSTAILKFRWRHTAG